MMKKKKVRALLAEMMGWHVVVDDGEEYYSDEDDCQHGRVDCFYPDTHPGDCLTCIDKWRELGEGIEIVSIAGGEWFTDTGKATHLSKSFTKAVAVCLAKSWKKLKKEKGNEPD